MGKGVAKDAFANSGKATGISDKLGGRASDIYGTVAPQLTAEATHPMGYSPKDKAAMNTAGQQSTGGSMAGATGQGALLAARTRNAGTADAAIAESARAAGQNLSEGALKTETDNAKLKEGQRQAGLSGLEGLYGTDVSGELGGLNASNAALKTANDADDSSSWWKKYLVQQAGNAVSGAASKFAGI